MFAELVRQTCRVGVGLVACVLVPSLPTLSQTASVRLAGRVADQTGMTGIAGATVTVTDKARGLTRTLTTDNNGRFEATDVVPGIYAIRVISACLPIWERTNIRTWSQAQSKSRY